MRESLWKMLLSVRSRDLPTRTVFSLPPKCMSVIPDTQTSPSRPSRGGFSQQVPDAILEQGLGARADVGSRRLVTPLGDGLIRTNISGAAVAIPGDSHEVTSFGLLSKELELD